MKILNKTIWAITPEMMGTMAEIARESRKTPETIAREMGREMKDTNAASIRDGVAVIKVSGPLFRYANLMTRICGATSYELLAQDFNKVARNRGISEDDVVNNFGAGDVSVGQYAVRNGLADGLSSFEDIISSLNQEKIIMNDITNAEGVRKSERERMAKVFAADISKGKEATAQILLAKTDLDATGILEILQTVPNAKENAFEKAMAALKNPDIRPAAEDMEETPEAVANRIASHIIGE